MNKIIVKIMSCFILNRKKRHEFRNKYLKTQNKSYLKYKDNNEFIIYKENGEIIKNPKILPDGLSINFMGNNSKIILYEPYKFINSCLILKDNSTVSIGKNCSIINLQTIPYIDNCNQLIIGENFNCVGCKIYLHDGNNNFIKIGKDCLFSFDIILWPHDGHPIYKKGTKEIINNPKDGVYIRDHVWVGRGVSLLKNTYIDNNTVIGANSLVCKSFKGQTNVVIAGNPAKIIKEDIDWDKEY